jgi:peptidoglycan/LPS O-acetylase OafA/YrhL
VQRVVHTLSVLGIDRRSAGPVSQLRDLLDAAGVAVCVGLIGLVIEGAVGPVRILLTLAFAFFVPGRAIVTNWPRFAYWSEFGMSIVLSLALLALVATVALWAHEWHPVGLFEIEAPLSVAALAVGMIRRHRGSEAERDQLDADPAALQAEMGPVEGARFRWPSRRRRETMGDD